MDKFENTYRDDLSKKLKEIRHDPDLSSEESRAKAQGYLEASREDKRYKDARDETVADREKERALKLDQKLVEEFREHAIDWMKECVDDPQVIDDLMAAINKYKELPFSVISHVYNYESVFGEYSLRPRPNLDQDLDTIIEEYRAALDKFKFTFDWKKFESNHPESRRNKNYYSDSPGNPETQGWQMRFGDRLLDALEYYKFNYNYYRYRLDVDESKNRKGYSGEYFIDMPFNEEDRYERNKAFCEKYKITPEDIEAEAEEKKARRRAELEQELEAKRKELEQLDDKS